MNIAVCDDEENTRIYIKRLMIKNEKEESYKQYNDFLNKLVINRVAPGIIVSGQRRF